MGNIGAQGQQSLGKDILNANPLQNGSQKLPPFFKPGGSLQNDQARAWTKRCNNMYCCRIDICYLYLFFLYIYIYIFIFFELCLRHIGTIMHNINLNWNKINWKIYWHDENNWAKRIKTRGLKVAKQWQKNNYFPSIAILTHVAIWPSFQIEEFKDF